MLLLGSRSTKLARANNLAYVHVISITKLFYNIHTWTRRFWIPHYSKKSLICSSFIKSLEQTLHFKFFGLGQLISLFPEIWIHLKSQSPVSVFGRTCITFKRLLFADYATYHAAVAWYHFKFTVVIYCRYLCTQAIVKNTRSCL